MESLKKKVNYKANRIVRGEMQDIEELWSGEIFEGEIRSCFWWTLKELHNYLRSLGTSEYTYKNNIERKVNVLKITLKEKWIFLNV